MRKKSFIVFVLTFILIFLPNTITYAAESDNIMTLKDRTQIQLIREYGVEIDSASPYVSKIFTPKTNIISYIFVYTGQYNSSGTFYIEKLNSNGRWSTVGTHNLKEGYSISTSIDVVPNNMYRVRVTTTNMFSNFANIEVFEFI